MVAWFLLGRAYLPVCRETRGWNSLDTGETIKKLFFKNCVRLAGSEVIVVFLRLRVWAGMRVCDQEVRV